MTTAAATTATTAPDTAKRARFANDLQSVYHHLLHILETRVDGHSHRHESAFLGDSLSFREARDYLIGNASALSNGYALANVREPVRTVGSTDRSWDALVAIAQAQLVLVAEVEELLQVDGYTGLTWEYYRADHDGESCQAEDRCQAAAAARKVGRERPAPLACSLHPHQARAHGLKPHPAVRQYPIHPGDQVVNVTGTVGTYQGLRQAGTSRETVAVIWDREQPAPEVKRGLTAAEWALVLDALEGRAQALWLLDGASPENRKAIHGKAEALDALAEKLSQDGVKR